jgi:small subunit ribosomal protein S20
MIWAGPVDAASLDRRGGHLAGARHVPESSFSDEGEHCPVANIKSQIKRIAQNNRAHERNKSVKSALRTSIRRFDEAVEAGDKDKAAAAAAYAARRLDKAVSAGVIHKNQAANRKSAIAKRAAGL